MQLFKVGLIALLVTTVALAGCFGGAKEETKAPPPPPKELNKDAQDRLALLAAPEFRNYTLPGSQRLEPKVQWFNDTLDPTANTAYQDRNDRGGNEFNVVRKTFDVSSMVPVGQPTALRLKLIYFGSPGNSAKADLYACVPGHCSAYTAGNNDQFNWKATVEVMNVVTIGVSGQPALVGVQAANGLITSGMPFALEVQANYFADVLTPVVGYEFTVPPGATGVTLKSVKPGQEHLKAKFVVLDPQDDLVAYQEYDDIAVVSESIFIPTRSPGKYVFYAQEMHNGFFSLTSDGPLGDNSPMTIITPTLVEGVLSNSPAPGVPDKDITGTGAPLPFTEGTKGGFSIDKGFPVEVAVTIKPGVVGAVEAQISSAKGLVYTFTRMGRVDQDGQGSLGYTRDETNTVANWANLAKGAYSASIVNDASTGDVGYAVKVLQR